MHTREEAIQSLQELGLFASARDWSFGASVCVWSSQETDPRTGITVCHDMVILYPESGAWHFCDPSAQRYEARPCGSLSAAVQEAVKHFAG
jgi:hypothetical protein